MIRADRKRRAVVWEMGANDARALAVFLRNELDPADTALVDAEALLAAADEAEA